MLHRETDFRISQYRDFSCRASKYTFSLYRAFGKHGAT
jgi:hypothetical protein